MIHTLIIASEIYIPVLIISIIIVFGLYRVKRQKKQLKYSERPLVNIHNKNSIETITVEHSEHISSAFVRINLLYSNIIRDLAIQDYVLLQKNKKKLNTLNMEVEGLKDDIFIYLQTKEDNSEVKQFYILTLENLEDMVLAMTEILKISRVHINKNHKKLTFNQIRDLKSLDAKISSLFNKIEVAFKENSFDTFDLLASDAKEILNRMTLMLENHINKINSINNNPKNFKLYTKLIKKSSDLFGLLIEILNRYKDVYKQP